VHLNPKMATICAISLSALLIASQRDKIAATLCKNILPILTTAPIPVKNYR